MGKEKEEASKSKGKALFNDSVTQPGEGSGAASSASVGGKDAAAAASSGISNSKCTSTVWEHFDRVNVDGKWMAFCKYCPKSYSADPNHGTSTLRAHVPKCPKNPASMIDNTQTKLNFAPDGQVLPWHFDQQVCRNALSKMIIMHELPFSFVEYEWFREFCKAMCPMFKVHSRNTYQKDIFKTYEAEKLKLHEFFRTSTPRISLTTDTWTNGQQMNYMCITAHYIDDSWVLQKKLLNFVPITSHKGEDIGRVLETCLNSWGIDRIMAVTVDNASANKDAIEYLRVQLSNNMLGHHVLDGKHMHMRCLAHILNLIVSKGLEEVGKSIDKIRFVVKFIRSSSLRIDRFKTACDLAGYKTTRLLSLDVSTRWNSTFLMLDSVCCLEKAFPIYFNLDPSLIVELESRIWKPDGSMLGRLSNLDWGQIKSIMGYLKLYFLATARISGSTYATSNMILDEISDIDTFIKDGMGSDNISMRNVSFNMSSKFNKYFGDLGMLNMFTFLSTVFDPRKKLNYVNFLIKEIYSAEHSAILIPCVKLSLNDIFEHYAKEYGTSGVPTQPDSSVSVGERPSKYRKFEKYKLLLGTSEVEATSELERYLNEKTTKDFKDFNILTWWAQNAHRYPIISRIARDILAIPSTSVPSECIFSGGSRILDSFRSSLSTRMVQALLCTQDWLKGTPAAISFEAMVKEMELMQVIDDEIDDLSTPIGAPNLM